MYIRVRVTPGARKERMEQTADTTFAVSVREKAQRNLANTRVRELIAEHYNTTTARVRLISGHRSATKVFAIEL